jgi:hypothetical protein
MNIQRLTQDPIPFLILLGLILMTVWCDGGSRVGDGTSYRADSVQGPAGERGVSVEMTAEFSDTPGRLLRAIAVVSAKHDSRQYDLSVATGCRTRLRALRLSELT